MKYCQQEKQLIIYGYVIMSNHIHLIVQSENGRLSEITPRSATTAPAVATQNSTSTGIGLGTSIQNAWSSFTNQVSSGFSQMENWIKSGYGNY